MYIYANSCDVFVDIKIVLQVEILNMLSNCLIYIMAVFILETHYASGRTWARFYYSFDYPSVV